jgi:hypothetical protein
VSSALVRERERNSGVDGDRGLGGWVRETWMDTLLDGFRYEISSRWQDGRSSVHISGSAFRPCWIEEPHSMVRRHAVESRACTSIDNTKNAIPDFAGTLRLGIARIPFPRMRPSQVVWPL